MIFEKPGSCQLDTSLTSMTTVPPVPVVVPDYLEKTYWWAYTHPNAVRVFERQWLVNLILWGNFSRLRDLALHDMGEVISGQVLQVACVYGNLTEHLVRRLDPLAHLSVIDVAPVQIKNLHQKLRDKHQVSILQQDASNMGFVDASQDSTLVFFLLHEMPVDVRRQTIAEALRVTKPGGKVIFVDYHKPVASSPFRYIMVPILTTLEPFAMDLWHHEITEWLPTVDTYSHIEKQTYFGGLYQKVVITR